MLAALLLFRLGVVLGVVPVRLAPRMTAGDPPKAADAVRPALPLWCALFSRAAPLMYDDVAAVSTELLPPRMLSV